MKKDSFKFTPISEEETLKHLQNLFSKKATGLDGMPGGFIKDGATQITAPITHIINLFLHSGNFLGGMKIARVVPLYKNKSKTDPGNYRPVSILSVYSNKRPGGLDVCQQHCIKSAKNVSENV